MISEIESLLDSYAKWLRDKTHLRQIEEWVEITTPFLDRHNDYIQIYARKQNGGYFLTDDGQTINDLEQSGCKIQSFKRQNLFRMVLGGFGVQEEKGQLQVFAQPESFSLRKHNLIQAILAVNDMFYLSVPSAAHQLFYEDVMAWLDENDIRYNTNLKLTGKSGYDHVFDFMIPKSRTSPERVLRAINRPSRDTAEAAAFSWIDVREVRSPEARAYAILNDADSRISYNITDALRSYDLRPVIWSKRAEVVMELAA